MTTPLPRTRAGLAALALAVALVPVAAGPARAAAKPRRHHTKRALAKKPGTPRRAAADPTAPTPTPAAVAAAAAPASASVISIGGYVFYNLSYAEAVAAYQAAVAAAPAGYTPPPVTSISLTTTVSGTG